MKRRGPQVFKASRHRHRDQQRSEKKLGSSEAIVLNIESLNEEGAGLAHYQGRPIVVAGALPGEQVEAQILAKYRRYDEAQLLKVITPAAERIKPRCEYFGECGGCQLQHLAIQTQRQFKYDRLKSMLSKTGYQGEIRRLESPEFSYRHRARLVFKDGQLGYRAANSQTLVPIQQCLLLSPGFNSLLEDLRHTLERSEERRVGKACCGTGSSRWSECP